MKLLLITLLLCLVGCGDSDDLAQCPEVECPEGQFCNGDGACDSPGTCMSPPPLDCGVPLNPDGTRDETAEVCGCDGITYFSECIAVTSLVRIASSGACP